MPGRAEGTAEETSCLCERSFHESTEGFQQGVSHSPGRADNLWFYRPPGAGGLDREASSISCPGEMIQTGLTWKAFCGLPWPLMLTAPPSTPGQSANYESTPSSLHCQAFALGYTPARNTFSEKMGPWQAGRAAEAPSIASGCTSTESTSYKWNFFLCWFEFADVEPVDMEGRLYNTILYTGLVHQRILVYSGVLEPIPCGS